jgi:hypothetical protein
MDSKESIPPAFVARARTFKCLWGPGIDAKEWIPPCSLCSLAGRYENPILPRCLAPIDFLKIPALSQKLLSRYGARNRFQEPSLDLVAKLHRLACRYVNPMRTWFLLPILAPMRVLSCRHWRAGTTTLFLSVPSPNRLFKNSNSSTG